MKFAESHEWIEESQDNATVGISQFAQKELGDIVYVELPEVGREIQIGNEVAVLESTKAASDVYSPVSGVITEVNLKLRDAPELINQSPENEGWIYKIKLTNPAELEKLMTQEKYLQTING